jgi:hypothetical protein
MNRRKALLTLLATVAVPGCAYTPELAQSDVDALAAAIAGLGSDVDPGEARRAAEIAYSYSLQLARDYNVTDPPIIHNNKVHNGQRQRGLCNHYAEDLSKRLREEGFRTLEIQRAISPPTAIRIIHHTVVVTRPGDTIYEGIVLDGWRHGGNLVWAPTKEDTRYNWRPRDEVVEELLAKEAAKAAREGG